MSKPRLLDLFCGAGGCSVGYHRAGFEVVGVDIEPQKNYPFTFVEMDALGTMRHLLAGGKLPFDADMPLLVYYLSDFDVIHASPPCQIHSCMTKGRHKDKLKNHINLIPQTRTLMIKTGLPYIIENVTGAKNELIGPVNLCGSMFDLKTTHGSQLRRHRLFECSFFVKRKVCNHNTNAHVIGVYGGGQHPQRRKIPKTIGVYGSSGGSSKRDYLSNQCFTVQDRRDAMGIDWMTGKELSQAIPPAYTNYLGLQLQRTLVKTGKDG